MIKNVHRLSPKIHLLLTENYWSRNYCPLFQFRKLSISTREIYVAGKLTSSGTFHGFFQLLTWTLIGNGHWRHALAKAATTSWHDVLPTLFKVQQLRFSRNREFEKTATGEQERHDQAQWRTNLHQKKTSHAQDRAAKKVSCPPRTTSSSLLRPTKRRYSGSWRHWSLACKPCDDISCAEGKDFNVH